MESENQQKVDTSAALASELPAAQLQHMPLDWLGACFDFLSLRDLHAVAIVSPIWHQAIGRMRSPPTADVQRVLALACVPRSLLSSRINKLRIQAQFNSASSSWWNLPEPLLPFSLRRLEVQISSLDGIISEEYKLQVHRLMCAIFACVQLTTIKLQLSIGEPRQAELQLITSLPNLTALKLVGFRLEVREHIDALRSLPKLSSLRVGPVLPEILVYLLRAPFHLPLTDLDFSDTLFSDSHAPAFHSPLHLQRFTPLEIEVSSIDFLRMLPSLHTLTLIWKNVKAPSAETVCAGLSALSAHLTCLDLVGVDVKNDHVSQILTLFPQLAELRLASAPNLRNLDCFSGPGPHQSNLKELSLFLCGGNAPVPHSELKHLLSLHAIERLHLDCVFELTFRQQHELNSEFKKLSDRARLFFIPWADQLCEAGCCLSYQCSC